MANATPGFQTLLSTYGPGNFSFGVNGGNLTGITNVTFKFSRVTIFGGTNTTYTEYWIGNLSSGGNTQPSKGSLLSPALFGPFTYSGPAEYHYGPYSTRNWAGYELWAPHTPSLYGDQSFGWIPGATRPPASQAPTNVPSGQVVWPVGSMWIGLSPGSDGQGGLFQTGVDQAPISNNGRWSGVYSYYHPFWWEFYPSNVAQYYFGWSGTYLSGSAGDNYLSEQGLLSLNPGTCYLASWYQLDFDLTNWQFGLNMMYPAVGAYPDSCSLKQWTPYYGQQIEEAFSYSHIQQITQLTYPLPQWYSAGIQDSSWKFWPTNYLHGNGNFNDEYLNQASGVRNTNEPWLSSNGGELEVTWSTSSYNYNYV